MWVVETPPTATPKPLVLSEDTVQQLQYLTRFEVQGYQMTLLTQ
jgi:hypothetical protein